jgi:LacI family transcriptional regulator
MKLETVTIKDIARALNVSKSTVSRAFKDAPDVNTKTKKRILEYAGRMNYSPNLVASGLKEGKSHSIGLIVSEIANSFFSQVINGAESVAYKKGYRVIITQSYESRDREILNVQQLCSYSVDGLLISLSNNTSDISYLEQWHKKGLPIVLFDKVTDEIDTHKVVTNNYTGAFRATEHLIRQKFKRIAHVTGPFFLSTTNERLEGYKAALKKNNIPFNQELVSYCDHGKTVIHEVEKTLKKLFTLKNKPDAILAASDSTTVACFQVLKKMNKEKSIGLAGFSNNELCSLLSPAITVIHQPAFEIGRIAMELLIQLIESKEPIKKFEKKVVRTNLIIRDSTQKKS